MKAFITVIGHDTVGIIAAICNELAKEQVNVLDISQTVLQENFTMVMLVDIEKCLCSFGELSRGLERLGQEMGLVIHISREEIFNAMHRI